MSEFFYFLKLDLLFKKFVFFWIQSKTTIESDLQENFPLDLTKPINYILKKRFFMDLLILEYQCRKRGWPKPLYKEYDLPKTGNINGRVLFLMDQKSLLGSNEESSGLKRLIEETTSKQKDVNLVPVSVFWGRNPGSQAKSSLFKLLFLDEEYSSPLRRAFMFIAHGREVLCHFGKPISVLNEITTNENRTVDELIKKFSRVLRVHFRRQRDAILGPSIYDYATVIRSVLQSPNVSHAIAKDAQKKGGSLERSNAKAQAYIKEIAAKQSHNVVLFLHKILTFVFKKVYEKVHVYHEDEIRHLSEKYEIVYVPCHRSHMDYLLLGCYIYTLGFMPPHSAAGINLNFWPIGPILRRGGGFFIRRSFKGNRLYGAIFNEYVQYLLTHGYPLSFYPEGGRSRTGLTLPPKMGMLSMVVQSCKRQLSKPIVLIPMYIGYDKIMEERSYAREREGLKKESESIFQLLRARQNLKKNFGKAYLNFGDPIFIEDDLNKNVPNWRDLHEEDGVLSKKLTPYLHDLGNLVVQGMNNACVVSSSSLFATFLLSVQKRSLTEKDLLEVSDKMLFLLEEVPYSKKVVLPSRKDLRTQLVYVQKLVGFSRFSHEAGDVLHVNESQSHILNYYRNNALSVFILPAIVASMFDFKSQRTIDDVVESSLLAYSFLRRELYLKFTLEEAKVMFKNYVLAFQKAQLLKEQDGMLIRPSLHDSPFLTLRLMGAVASCYVEKYAIYGSLLWIYVSKGNLLESLHFEESALKTLERVSLLMGVSSMVYDHGSFKNFLEELKSRQLLSIKDSCIVLDPTFEAMAKRANDLLREDIKETLTGSF